MILVIDNYDSFVFNLARYIREEGFEVCVVRNDSISAEALVQTRPAGVVISPGPRTPAEAGVSLDLIKSLPKSTPLLGVCLGHQCLIEAMGGVTVRAKEPMHGAASAIRHDGQGVFEGIENPMVAGRYHSLVGLPPNAGALRACAFSDHDEVMAVRRTDAPWHGVQFHPESLLTPRGRQIIRNFLSYCN